MDGFLPMFGVMTRFWIFGLMLLGLKLGMLYWSDAPEPKVSNSDYIVDTAGFVLAIFMWLFIPTFCFYVFRSENWTAKSREGLGATPYRQGPIMAGVCILIITPVLGWYIIKSFMLL